MVLFVPAWLRACGWGTIGALLVPRLNRITRDIRAGCIEGFARHGADGRGKDGFAGYIFFLAKRHPKAAAKIIERLLRAQRSGAVGDETGPLMLQASTSPPTGWRPHQRPARSTRGSRTTITGSQRLIGR